MEKQETQPEEPKTEQDKYRESFIELQTKIDVYVDTMETTFRKLKETIADMEDLIFA